MAAPPIFKVVRGERVPDSYKPERGEKVKYRFVVDLGDDPKTGARRQLTRTFTKKRDAEKALARILDQTNRGIFAAPSKITLDWVLDEWLRSATRGKEENTKSAYTNGIKPARRFFGPNKLLQKVTTVDVEDLCDWMLEEGRIRGGKPGTPLSPRSVQITLGKIKAALDMAVHRRYVEYNVASPVKCPPQVTVSRKPWLPVEVKKFLAYLDEDRLRAPLLMSLIGMRPEEVCGLRWIDVDLDGGTLTIANVRTLVWDESGGHVVEKGPKTAAGGRTLPLPKIVTKALKKMKKLQKTERDLAGEGYTRTGYVLVDELGLPQRTDWLRRRTYRLMRDAGVREVRLYDARHACLTYLLVSGVPDVIVGAWAGHADLSMAKKVYTHIDAKDLVQGRDALSELLRPAKVEKIL